MPPLRTSASRASKACTACRARKTRCYEGPGATPDCLRCSTLHLPCSLIKNREGDLDIQPMALVSSIEDHHCSMMDQRVRRLEKVVERLSQTLVSRRSSPEVETTPTGAEQSAPLMVIRDAASSPHEYRHNPGHASVVDKGLLTARDADSLLKLFRQHCGRWIAIDESLLDPLQTQSPLLSCACCLVAARHTSLESSTVVATTLFAEAKALLGECLMSLSHDIEFFQAVLVLSLWSSTVGQEPLSMDSWLITGIAFQHDIAMRTSSGTPLSSIGNSRESRSLEKAAVWTHLCLSHLHACISMRRKSMLAKSDIDKIHKLVLQGQISNYETRMIAELLLYWTIYQECVAAEVVLTRGQAALQMWKKEWSFLFEQPRHHFLQMSFWFAQLLMYEQSLHNKSAAVRESLVWQMQKLCSDILRLAIDATDERTPYLTDHIYHMITFAGVTLCRLLGKYQSQLKSSYNIDDMDGLILETANWLRAIGSRCHIGNTMGETILSVHRRFRPDKHATSPWNVNDQADYNSTIPQFLALDAADIDWDEMLQDWNSLSSDEPALSGNGIV